MPAVEPRPSTVKLSVKALLALPFRLCNPPPAIGKVRSFGLTPLFNVRLDDVLARKHLPPLGLKDFEEWLLYVEMCPENLYFILWLRQYRQMFVEWQKQRISDPVSAMSTAQRLSLFYSRAKQTFLISNGNFELNLSSAVLAPFHGPDQESQPDPSFFHPVEMEVKEMLEQSLRRFIHAQMNNVGNRRVLCGVIAGIFIIAAGFIPPTVVTLAENSSRWLRLTAFPGMWLGLTILLCAIHGVCLGVYIFGDLRQLRKFELARPAISKPLHASDYMAGRHRSQHGGFPIAPPPVHTRSRHIEQKRPSSSKMATSSDNSRLPYARFDLHFMTLSKSSNNAIDGPTTCPKVVEDYHPENDGHEKQKETGKKGMQMEWEEVDLNELSSHAPFTATATFISPFYPPSSHRSYWDSDHISSWTTKLYQIRATSDLEGLSDNSEVVSRQPLADFDFDGLPQLRKSKSSTSNHATFSDSKQNPKKRDLEGASSGWSDEEPSRWQWLLDFMDRAQTRCSFKKWGLSEGDNSGPVFLGGVPPYLISSKSHLRVGTKFKSPSGSTLSLSTISLDTSTTERVKRRSKLARTVPAFSVPLTRILSPIICRAQWEIVVRSAGLSFFITWLVCGAILAIPVR